MYIVIIPKTLQILVHHVESLIISIIYMLIIIGRIYRELQDMAKLRFQLHLFLYKNWNVTHKNWGFDQHS